MNDELLSFASKVTSTVLKIDQARVLDVCGQQSKEDIVKRDGDLEPVSVSRLAAAVTDVTITVILNCDAQRDRVGFKQRISKPTLVQSVLIKRAITQKLKEYDLPTDLVNPVRDALFSTARDLPDEGIEGAVDQAIAFTV